MLGGRVTLQTYITAGMHVLCEMHCPDSAVLIIHVEIIQGFSHLLFIVYLAYTPNFLLTAMDERTQALWPHFEVMEWSYTSGQLVCA